MKHLHHLLSAIAMLSLIVVVLVTSAEAAIYIDFDFYEREYTKYEVLDELEMDMGEVMYVTYEMMDYLRGDRDNLVVETKVDGREREFFNDREKAHMIDVKGLFLGALRIRRIAIAVLLVAFALLFLMKADVKRMLPVAFQIEVAGLLVVSAVAAYLFTTDFTTYFYKFHEIFFDNDLWILDPQTDLMIRMLPEGFFFDFAMRIVVFIVISISALFVISIIARIIVKKKEDRAVYE